MREINDLHRWLNDLKAVAEEHATDDDLKVAKLTTDQMLYGFCVIDASGERVDPTTMLPDPLRNTVLYYDPRRS